MQHFQTEGIILHTTNFRDNDKILSIFTADHGLVKAIIHRARGKGKSPIEPLVQGEFVLSKGRSEIHQCKEMSIKNRFLTLREDFSHLEAACDFLQAIQLSQLVEKPALNLYLLLKCYLEAMGRTQDAKALAASFRLKILRHDGLLNLEPEQLSPYFFPEEIPLVFSLATSRSSAELTEKTISSVLLQKVKDFFKRQITFE